MSEIARETKGHKREPKEEERWAKGHGGDRPLSMLSRYEGKERRPSEAFFPGRKLAFKLCAGVLSVLLCFNSSSLPAYPFFIWREIRKREKHKSAAAELGRKARTCLEHGQLPSRRPRETRTSFLYSVDGKQVGRALASQLNYPRNSNECQ